MYVSRSTIAVVSILLVCGCRTFPYETAADRTTEFNSNRIPELDEAADGNPAVNEHRRTSSLSERSQNTGSPTDEPSSLAELIRRGNSEAAQGRYEEAKRFYRRALQIEPNSSMAHHRLAVIADNQRDFPTAEHHYRIAVETDPNNPNLLNDVGYSYLLQGRYGQSEHFLQDALRLDPTLTRAAKNLGLLYGSMGDYDRALAAFRRTGSEQEAQACLAELFPQRSATGTQQYYPAASQAGYNSSGYPNSAWDMSQQQVQAASNEYAAGPSGASPTPGVGLTAYNSPDQQSHYSANRPQQPAATWTSEPTDQQRPIAIRPGNTWAASSEIGLSPSSHAPHTNGTNPRQSWPQNVASPGPQAPSNVMAGTHFSPAGNTAQPSNVDTEPYRPSSASIQRRPVGQGSPQTDRLGPTGAYAATSDLRTAPRQPVYRQEGHQPDVGAMPASSPNNYGSNQAQYSSTQPNYPAQSVIQQQDRARGHEQYRGDGRGVGFQRQGIEATAYSGPARSNQRPVAAPHHMVGYDVNEARRTAAIVGLDVGPGSPFPVSNGPLAGTGYSGNAAGRLPDAIEPADTGFDPRQQQLTNQSGSNYYSNPSAAVIQPGMQAGMGSPWKNAPTPPAAQQPARGSAGQPAIHPGLGSAGTSQQSSGAWPQGAWNHSTPAPGQGVQSAFPNDGRWPVQQGSPARRPYPSTQQMPSYSAPPAGWSAQGPVSNSTNIPVWPSAPQQN